MKNFICILLMVILMMTIVPVSAEENSFSADDKNIKYVGRWVKSEDGKMEGSFECSLAVRFTGTGISLKKGFSGGMFYSIDGGECKRVAGKKLATDLDEGEHTLEIYAVAQQAFPKIAGFELDEGAKLLPAEDKPVIEFIGDSILEGYVIGNNSVLNSYGHRTAQKLGFYRNIVAFGGITVTQGRGNPDNQGMVNRYFMQKEFSPNEPVSEKWDTSKFMPDYIVINLGTNDSRTADGEFQMWYTTLLLSLRGAYKNAEIFVMTTLNGTKAEAIKQVYESTKDEKMHLIDASTWGIEAPDNLHPEVEGHETVAEKLAAEITEILSKTPEPEQTEQPTDNGTKPQKSWWWIPVAIVAVIAIAVGIILVVKKK